MIDDVFADCIDGGSDFSLYEIEVAVDSLLKQPALWLDVAVHCVLFNKRYDLFLCQEGSGPHMIMILLHADVTSCCFFPYATV